MSPSIRIRRAAPEDDAAICRLLAETEMTGQIRIANERPAGYGAASVVEGRLVESLVAVAGESELVGLGTRAEKPAFVNGKPARIGYLSGLRIRPAYRNGLLIARGYRDLRAMHEAGNVPFYLSTIVADNHEATRLLTSGRAGLPSYHAAGSFHSLVYGTKGHPSEPSLPGMEIRAARADELPQVLAFLNREGPRRQFFPAYERDDFDQGLLKGLACEDLLLARSGGEIQGLIGLWSQGAYRRSRICGYRTGLRLARPLWNAYASLTGQPQLPRPGTALSMIYLSLCCIREDRPEIFRGLLQAALTACSAHPGLHGVAIGFHARDPLLVEARKMSHRLYTSELYIVHWDDGTMAVNELDERVPYLEIGSL